MQSKAKRERCDTDRALCVGDAERKRKLREPIQIYFYYLSAYNTHNIYPRLWICPCIIHYCFFSFFCQNLLLIVTINKVLVMFNDTFDIFRGSWECKSIQDRFFFKEVFNFFLNIVTKLININNQYSEGGRVMAYEDDRWHLHLSCPEPKISSPTDPFIICLV